MDYLLDPSWIINVLAGRGDAAAYHRNLPLDRVAISFVSVGEIYKVAFTYANPEAHLASFRQFLAPYTQLPQFGPENILGSVP
jgi:predicted nucleic acid-binding protein